MPENYKPWIKKVAQVGLVSKSLVYMLFGFLILRAAYTAEDPVGLMELIKFIINQDDTGRISVGVLSFGLYCYAAWKYAQMVLNVEDYDRNVYGYATRFTWLGPFVFYVVLGSHGFVQLYRWYFGSFHYFPGQTSDFGRFLTTSEGKYIIGLLAIVFLVNACTLFYLALSGKYRIMLTGRHFHETSPRLARSTGLFGYLSYGLALFITATLFGFSIYYADVSYIKGQESMFYFLMQQSWGKALLTIISVGTISYGAYFMLTAYFRWRLGSANSTSTGK